MFGNYFKIAVRNLLGKKVYSAINILGLSVGLACSFFILLWVRDETSYDRFHKDGDQIHQAWRHMTTGGQTYTMSSLPKRVADEMVAEFPEVREIVATLLDQQFVVTMGDRNYRENGGYATPTFFRMFTFPFIQGNPEMALQGVNSAVITEKTARKLFGNDWGNVLGRSIIIDHGKEFTITGVVRDVPKNSSIQFDVLLPIREFFDRDERYEHWYFMAFGVYAKLQEGVSLDGFNGKVADLFNRHTEATDHQIFLQPFEEVYLNSVYKDGQLAGGRIEYVRIFTAIAIFLLLIACINFMNLATARSSQRACEIGVRKVIGAHQRSLIAQFITESVAMAFVAFLIALILVVTLLPAFNYLTGKHFTPGILNGTFLFSILGIALMVGVVSGSYPALYLSSFKPVAVLRGTFRQRSGTVVTLRKGLVVFQFALSVLLIVSTVAVYLQLDYIRTKNLGLDRENLLFVTREGALLDRYDAVAKELLMQPGIASVTASGQNPLKIGNNTTGVDWPAKEPDNHQLFYIINATYDFAKTMKMELVAGRDFSRVFGADSMSYLVNEETAELMGGDVVGKMIKVYGQSGPIVGIVKNFSMNSLYSAIEPAIIRFHPEWAGYLYVRTEPGQTREALEGLEAVHKKFNPDYPIQYTFLDQKFEQTYRSEAVMGTLANIFAVIALFISCLGLFGLTSFTVEQRTKELGVRKVLGASVAGIVVMLSRDFLKLVLIGFVIATPVTWYATNQWLENFADRIDIGAGVFLLAGLAAILIALATVSLQSIKAAIANPVDCLRNE
jgi:predicted permease